MAQKPADAPVPPETGPQENAVPDSGAGSDDSEPLGVPTTTDAIQAVQRRNWIRGLSIGIGVGVLLIALGWIAGSIANQIGVTPAQRALAALAAADDTIVASAEAPAGIDATLRWSNARESAAISATGLPELESDNEYVVWFIDDDEDATRITDFRATAGEAIVLLPEMWTPGQTVVVTTEAVDHDDSDGPDGDPVMTFEPPGAP